MATASLLLTLESKPKSECDATIPSSPVLEVEGQSAFTTVIIGGGTAGCTVAYLLAKWMDEQGLPGTVLLVERGHDYSPTVGPDPRLKSWFDIWGGFGEAHMTIHKTGEHYPVPATDHRGLGGCSTHDTRINFQLTPAQLTRMAAFMGWEMEQIQTYFQAALNLIPVSRAIPLSRPEAIHNDVISVLTSNTPYDAATENDITLDRVLASDEDGEKTKQPRQDNEYNTVVKPNSVAEVSMSMYGKSGEKPGSDEVRYVSAYLVHEKVRPKNLKVLCNMTVDRVLFEHHSDASSSDCTPKSVRASGVVVQDDRGQSWTIQLGSYSALDAATDEKKNSNQWQRQGDVVIANGSLGATALLQRSGIGPSKTLREAGVEVLVDNAEVGHGVDHLEISLVNELPSSESEDGSRSVVRGGPTGWPLVLFADLDTAATQDTRRNVNKPFPMYRPNTYFQAHFGAGTMDPNFDEPVMEMTPLIVNPDPDAGFRGHITSKNPRDSLLVINEDQSADLEAMGHAVRKGVQLLEKLEHAGVCGPRVLPPPDLPLSDMPKLVEWIKENHWTVYHWCSTCKAGLPGIGTVADENFRVRYLAAGGDRKNNNVIGNLFVGSAASLPEITEPNPHLTITAFSVALAEQLLKSQYHYQDPSRRPTWTVPTDITQAAADLDRSKGDGVLPSCVIRRQGEERPALWDSVVNQHHQQWMHNHSDDE